MSERILISLIVAAMIASLGALVGIGLGKLGGRRVRRAAAAQGQDHARRLTAKLGEPALARGEIEVRRHPGGLERPVHLHTCPY